MSPSARMAPEEGGTVRASRASLRQEAWEGLCEEDWMTVIGGDDELEDCSEEGHWKERSTTATIEEMASEVEARLAQ